MKKCFIFAGGYYDGFFDQIHEDDYIIAADKGYTYLQKEDIEANLIIGDFDSAKEPDFKNKIKLQPEKDETDLYAAIKIGFDKGLRNFYIYGALGGRLSHTIGNIKIMEEFKKKGADVILKSKNQMAFVIDKSFREDIYIKDTYVSIFALSDEVNGLYLKNLKYPLNNYKLKNHMHLGVSNECLGIPFCIEFNSGILLVIYEKKSIYS